MKDFNAGTKTVAGNEGEKCSYPTRLDTYGCGCQHDCSYCYAKSLLDFRKLWNAERPSVGNIKKIALAVKKSKRGDVIRLGGMTDCFQPLERVHRVTYKTIKLLNRYKREYLIVTKSAMVADDEYISILDKELAHIQITVTTLDDALCATYEKASPPSERIKAILKLQAAGFDVQLRLSPYIPEYIDVDKLNALGIDRVLVEFLRVNTWIEKWFDIDYGDYTHAEGGYKHLPLEKKIALLDALKFKEISVCEDADEAYEYWRQHVNANPLDCCNLRR